MDPLRFSASVVKALDRDDEESLKKLCEEMLNPCSEPLPCSTTDRNEIMSGKVSVQVDGKSVNIDLSKEQIEGLLQFSNEIKLNERECLRLWRSASHPESRRLCERFLALPSPALLGGVAGTARALFALERRSVVDSLLLLLRARNRDRPSAVVMHVTNDLLRRGLFSNILKALQRSLEQLSSRASSHSPDANSDFPSDPADFALQNASLTRVLSECVFFLAYNTRLTRAEVLSLLNLCSRISSLLSDRDAAALAMPAAALQDHSLYLKFLASIAPWRATAVTALVILQISLFCSLTLYKSQSGLNREEDKEPYTKESTRDNGSESDWDSLFKEMHGIALKAETWRCRGARGFMFALLAVMSKADHTERESASSEKEKLVEELLNESAVNRAFTFIRLCMLPVLEHAIADNSISSHAISNCDNFNDGNGDSVDSTLDTFLSDSLEDFLLEFARVCSMRQDFGRFVKCVRVEAEKEARPTEDCLDDLMHLYAVACQQLSSLPLALANDAVRENGMKSNSMGFGDEADQSEANGEERDYQYHPFFVRCIELSWQDPFLMLAGLRLLGAVGRYVWSVPPKWRNRVGSNCMSIYRYMRENSGPRRNICIWEFIFKDCIDMFASRFDSQVLVVKKDSFGSNNQIASYQQSTGMKDNFLSDIDCEYLIAIADLIGSLSRCSEVSMRISNEYQVIPRLFALLACPISIFLKGALFKALAALSFSSIENTREIWFQIETYDMLNVNVNSGINVANRNFNAPRAGNRFYNSNNNNSSQQQQVSRGIKHELDNIETVSGAYPATEGFLVLLEALLDHGVPDFLGQTYRSPGIMSYIEFVVDEVLMKAKSRKYVPNNFIGTSQRWRITARTVRILSTILRHYNINRIDESFDIDDIGLDNGNEWEQLCASVPRKDFVDPRQSKNVNKQTQKSAGFIVMAMLLSSDGHTKLLNQILSLLQECDLNELNKSKQIMMNFGAESSAAIATLMQPPEKAPKVYGVDENMSRVGLMREASATCDGWYWRDKTISACIGLLHECCLREKVFIQNVRNSRHLITYLRSEQGKTVSVSVLPQSLVDGLSSGIRLSKIASFMNLRPGASLTFPSVSSMVVLLLDYIGEHQSVPLFLGSMSDSVDGEEALMACCVSLLVKPTQNHLDLLLQGNINKLSKDNGSLYLCTPSLASATSSSPQICSSDAVKILLANHHIHIPGGQETIRESILRLILSTLSPHSLCFAHTLLGFKQQIEKIQDLSVDWRQLDSILSVPLRNRPMNCFEAIIEMLRFEEGSIILSSPSIAMICYEILYRLCSQHLTAEIVLTILRKPEVNFIFEQLHILSQLCLLSDDNLKNMNKFVKDFDVKLIEDIKVARHHCVGWFLQICSLELRSLEKQKNMSEEKILKILLKLFGDYRNVVETDNNTLCPVVEYLWSAFDLPEDKFPVVNSKIILSSLDEASTRYIVGKGVGNGFDSSQFTIIDLSQFSKSLILKYRSDSGGDRELLRDEVEAGLRVAVGMNVFQQRMAASTHLARAWGELCDIVFVGHIKSALYRCLDSHTQFSLSKCIDLIVLPTLSMFMNVECIEMIMVERVLQSVFVMLSTIFSSLSPQFLTKVQHHSILSLLIEILFRGSKTQASHSVKATSAYFRGLIYSLLSLVLTFGKNKDMDFRSPSGLDPSIIDVQKEILSRVSVELVELMCADSCAGPVVWKIASLSSIQSVVYVLLDSSSSLSSPPSFPLLMSSSSSSFAPSIPLGEIGETSSISPAFYKVLSVLCQKDYLKQMVAVSIAGLSVNYASFLAIISLCLNLARTREGAEEVIRTGLIQSLCSLQVFSSPFSDSSDNQSHQRALESSLFLVLNLFQTLVESKPTRHVLEGCLQFFRINHHTITFFLKLQSESIGGLKVVNVIVRLLGLTVNSSIYCFESNSQDLSFESILGQHSDSFTSDIIHLMQKIASIHFEKNKIVILQNQEKYNSSNKVLSKLRQKEIDFELDENEKAVRNQLLFEDYQEKMILDVFFNASAFLRSRVNGIIDFKDVGNNVNTSPQKLMKLENEVKIVNMASLMSIDFGVVMSIFTFILDILSSSPIKHEDDINFNDNRENILLNASKQKDEDITYYQNNILRLVSENLVCVIYAGFSITSTEREERKSLRQEIEKCYSLTGKTNQSFVRQILAWIIESDKF